MATRNGMIQIKDLVRNGELTTSRSWSRGFLFYSNGVAHAGKMSLEISGRFVYFFAKKFHSEFPCCNFRVNRNTTLIDLDNYIKSVI